MQALESFYEKFDPDFIDIRTKAREVLQREDDLNEIVQVHLFWYLLFMCIAIIFSFYNFQL